MGKSVVNGAQISIRSAKTAKFAQAFKRSKLFAAFSGLIWIYGLLELVVASTLKGSFSSNAGIAFLLATIISTGSVLYFRSGMTPWKRVSSCHLGPAEGGCSQAGCDLNAGGCLAKLNKEVAMRIADMERYKLSQLMRRKVGVDIILPIFWIIVGVKESMASSPPLVFGGLVVSVGALGLLLTRLYLGVAVFD